MQRALHGLEVSPLTVPVAQRATVVIAGSLVDDPSGPPHFAHVLLRVTRVDGASGGGRTVVAIGSGDDASRLRILSSGDQVTMRGELEPLDGFDTRERWRHAVGRFRVSELLGFAGPASPLRRVANSLRDAVLRGGSGLPPTERALEAGFLLGDTRAIPPELVTDFRDAGLSHLLAVSGANVAFVLVLAGPLLRRLRLGPRALGGGIVLVLFGTMTRWEPSVLRATVMAGAVLGANLLGRPAPAGRVLALAALTLLVVDPFLIHSVGFLLSCGACAGIVLLAPWLATRIPGPAAVREALSVTLAAQLGVAPVLLPVFGTVPMIALPANLLAVPVVGPLTIWGLIAGLVGGVAGPSVALVLQLPTLSLLRWVETVAGTAAETPLALDARGAWGVAALTGAASFGVGLARLRRRSASDAADRLEGDGRRVPREGE